jgi:autotransporter-associated beta strand protein
VTVVVDSNATVDGNPGDAIVMTGQNNRITFAGGGTMRDVTIGIAVAPGSSFSGMFLNAGSVLENDLATNTIAVGGDNALLAVTDPGSLILTANTIAIGGSGSRLELTNGGAIEATAGLTGPLIQGDAGAQQFVFGGTLRGSSVGGLTWYLDAGDGNDTIQINPGLQLLDTASTLLVQTTGRFDGGAGDDTLRLEGSGGLGGSFEHSTTDIERLHVAGSGNWSLGGSHAFSRIAIDDRSRLNIGDFTSLGLANSQISIDRTVFGSGNLVISDAGTHQFEHELFGAGDIQFLAGDYTFQTASPFFNGRVSNQGGHLRIANSLAFGQASIDNVAQMTLTDVVLDNRLSGNGTIYIDGTRSQLSNTLNSMQGAIIVQGGEFYADSLRVIGNGNSSSPPIIQMRPNTQFVLDLADNGPLDLQATHQVLGNPLVDAGTFVKRGPGSVIIDGSNIGFTGETRLEGGWLHIADQDGLGDAFLASNRIVFAGGGLSLGDITLRNQLSGTGVIDKSTAGRTTVTSDNNSASLTWTLNAGTLAGTTSRNFGGSGSLLYIGNATLELDSSASQNLDLRLSGIGTSTFRKLGTGRLTIVDLFQMQNLAVDAGTVAIANPTTQFQANQISIASGATFELSNAGDYTLASTVSGVGTFRKLGAGRLSFGNTFAIGSLAIDAGSARVNQTITANTNIASGARLDGTGRIIGNVTNNGTVAPGNSIGTLTVQGNYVHNAGSVLEIEFDGNGGIDLLDVTGNVTLNGGTLRFVSLGGAEGSGGTFLRAGGTLTGTFSNVTTVGAQLPLAVIYEPNRAFMAPSVLTARPSTFNAQFLAAAESGFGFIDRVDAALARKSDGTRLWIEGFGNDGKRSAGGQTLAYGHDGYGIGGGMTLSLGSNLTVGLSAGWSRGDIKLAQNGGGGEQDSVLGALALGYHGRGIAISGGMLAGKVDQATVRNVSFNGFAASVSGATQSTLYGGYLGLAMDLADLGDWKLGGELRGSWIRQKQDGYTENGTSPLRLSLGDLSADTLEAQTGLTMARQLGGDHGGADLWFGIGARLLWASGNRQIPVTFAASNAGVTLQGDTRDPVHGYANAGVGFSLSGSARAWLAYAGQAGANDRHEGRVGLSIGF